MTEVSSKQVLPADSIPVPTTVTTGPAPKLRRVKRVGVLTSGGDCPGLNAVIRAIAKTAIQQYGIEVWGIEDGFIGLIQNRMQPMRVTDVSNILTLGGTILGTNNKCDPRRYAIKNNGQIHYANVTDRCLEHIALRQLDALIVIGGDGSMAVAGHLIQQGVACIGVPKTIDNDLIGTDVTFGFGTAVAIASDAIDRIHTTAASHHRAMIIEVMGRNAGWIALHAGMASGADVILIPEIPFDIRKICGAVVQRSNQGKRSSILCISEGAMPKGGKQTVARMDPTSPDPIRLGGVGQVVGTEIEKATGIETRTAVLGHVQRGGEPTAADRVLATQFGYAAVELLAQDRMGRLVALQAGKITDVDIMEVVGKQRLVPLDSPLLQAARAIGTCFGD
ncbi:MAG: ATP-dependent 6-phosphofructokinase [Planctomycetia bacterium]|nr:ATP-dependent 6-phosphofructokinase [Planctomycetia bacterium]